jgi:hypothetical protein
MTSSQLKIAHPLAGFLVAGVHQHRQQVARVGRRFPAAFDDFVNHRIEMLARFQKGAIGGRRNPQRHGDHRTHLHPDELERHAQRMAESISLAIHVG